MLKSNKQTAPEQFSRDCRERNFRTWADTEGLSRPWREFLLTVEQDFMSCYTEEPLSVDDSHIDHFLVRDLFPQKDHVFD